MSVVADPEGAGIPTWYKGPPLIWAGPSVHQERKQGQLSFERLNGV